MKVISSVDRFVATHLKSKELWERSLKVSRGMHHDSRFNQPFPIYASYCKGSRKWDVDGNEYIDYTMGHGSLLFGHAHPALVKAVSEQVSKGTHYGAENELALEWAELITQLIPAAEKVEFVMTGTEANMMIAHIARAYTGRHKILKFAEHFFGWADHFQVGVIAPYDKAVAGRLPPSVEGAVSDATVVVPCNDEAALEAALAKEDVAALFLEGAGAHCGAIAMPPELVHKARQLTQRYGTLLVIDEVITGFRWSPGGYQAVVGVTPDLSALGKMVSGGVPGAAVCGRADLIGMLEIRPGQPEWNRYRRVLHPGTWNANPISAAAGVTMLKLVATGEPQKRAEAMAERLVAGINRHIEARGIEACAYNASSALHIYIGKCQKCDRTLCLDATKTMAPQLAQALDRHLLLNGVSMLRGTIGWVSAVHTDEDIHRTIEAFGAALDGMLEEGAINAPKG
ncbi:MAG TPA: aminotransferase class III-fold pyridoxal phosphate-dependent enzyme [Dehalococcoidia bacterium]|nr:aminotransferase class III-fold pyridoxal phosphate-dependent enzyme [Dehalococcoidia bacterium]